MPTYQYQITNSTGIWELQRKTILRKSKCQTGINIVILGFQRMSPHAAFLTPIIDMSDLPHLELAFFFKAICPWPFRSTSSPNSRLPEPNATPKIVAIQQTTPSMLPDSTEIPHV